MRPLIVWSAHKLEALENAIEYATANGHDVVEWGEQKSASQWSKTQNHTWPLTDAIYALNEAKAVLASNPMPEFPENKEGKEP